MSSALYVRDLLPGQEETGGARRRFERDCRRAACSATTFNRVEEVQLSNYRSTRKFSRSSKGAARKRNTVSVEGSRGRDPLPAGLYDKVSSSPRGGRRIHAGPLIRAAPCDPAPGSSEYLVLTGAQSTMHCPRCGTK
ncbi:hypothetical protein MTO96_007557 [Rhipicephalus appendiculatus]